MMRFEKIERDKYTIYDSQLMYTFRIVPGEENTALPDIIIGAHQKSQQKKLREIVNNLKIESKIEFNENHPDFFLEFKPVNHSQLNLFVNALNEEEPFDEEFIKELKGKKIEVSKKPGSKVESHLGNHAHGGEAQVLQNSDKELIQRVLIESYNALKEVGTPGGKGTDKAAVLQETEKELMQRALKESHQSYLEEQTKKRLLDGDVEQELSRCEKKHKQIIKANWRREDGFGLVQFFNQRSDNGKKIFQLKIGIDIKKVNWVEFKSRLPEEIFDQLFSGTIVILSKGSKSFNIISLGKLNLNEGICKFDFEDTTTYTHELNFLFTFLHSIEPFDDDMISYLRNQLGISMGPYSGQKSSSISLTAEAEKEEQIISANSITVVEEEILEETLVPSQVEPLGYASNNLAFLANSFPSINYNLQAYLQYCQQAMNELNKESNNNNNNNNNNERKSSEQLPSLERWDKLNSIFQQQDTQLREYYGDGVPKLINSITNSLTFLSPNELKSLIETYESIISLQSELIMLIAPEEEHTFQPKTW